MAARVVCWSRVLCLCGVTIVAIGAEARVALAQAPAASAEDVEEAKARFAAGNKAFEKGEYREAVSEFQGGYMLTRNPGFLLNIAVCYRKLGEAEQALSHFRDYLKAEPQSPRKAEVQKQINELEAQLGPQKGPDAAKGPARLADGTLDPAAAPAVAEPKAAPAKVLEKKPATPAAAPVPRGPLVDSAEEDDGMALVVTKRRSGSSPPRIKQKARPAPVEKDEEEPESSNHMWLWAALGGAVLTGVVVAFALSGQKSETGTLGSVDLR